jgi:Ca-activated chloride channel family protein
VSLAHPLLLLTLLVVPAAVGLHRLASRRRMRYAVRYTNVDVLAAVVGGRSWRRLVAPAVFLLALAVLCVAVTRPYVKTKVAADNATVILVLDVSGSMQAQDVKPTRLAAAQRALHTFLDKVPPRFKVGLILFAAEAQVATPPTSDHALVGQAVDDASFYDGFGGTAIGDALHTAVQLGLQVTGQGGATALGERSLASLRREAAGGVASTLVSILFLSDGRQTRGILDPFQGAAEAKQAGFPVYTVSLGTTGNTTLRGGGFFGGGGGGGGGGFFGGGSGLRRGLQPDPATLKAIAKETGGEFFRAKSAGAVQAAYSKLGSSIGRKPGKVEVTDRFLAGGAALLVLAGVLSALWAPRLP